MYNFPKKWGLYIKNSKALSKRLGIPIDFLKKLYLEIPKNYKEIKIPKKKKGEFRDLSVPSDKLKDVQRLILDKILKFNFSNYVQGGNIGCSIIKNALVHRRKKWVANLDLRDFFPSVHRSRIETVFLDLGCSKEVARILTRLITYNYELPQGAPTSPIVSNLVLYNLDKRIFGLCSVKKLNYTRYFDDITISGNRRIERTCDKIIKISLKERFPVHLSGPKKLKIIPSSNPQIVTGLVVNGKSLKASLGFLSDLESNLNLLINGKMPDTELYDLFEKTKGMIAFLKSVQPAKARFLLNKMKKITWKIYGIE